MKKIFIPLSAMTVMVLIISAQNSPVIKEEGMVKIGPVDCCFHPSLFFHDRKDKTLRYACTESVKIRLKKKAKLVSYRPPVTFNWKDIKKMIGAYPAIKDLNVKPVAVDDLDAFWPIEQLMLKQPNGEKGTLVSSGHANVFYFSDNQKTFVLFLHYGNIYDDEPGWWNLLCYDVAQNEVQWGITPGDRVFYMK